MKKSISILLLVLIPSVAFAANATHEELVAAEKTGNAIGKVIGGLLFGYLVMKFMNRNKDSDEPKGTSKILIAGLIGMIIFAIYWKLTNA